VRVRSAGGDGVGEGEHFLEFRYISLENNEERLFSRKFDSPSAGVGGS